MSSSRVERQTIGGQRLIEPSKHGEATCPRGVSLRKEGFVRVLVQQSLDDREGGSHQVQVARRQKTSGLNQQVLGLADGATASVESRPKRLLICRSPRFPPVPVFSSHRSLSSSAQRSGVNLRRKAPSGSTPGYAAEASRSLPFQFLRDPAVAIEVHSKASPTWIALHAPILRQKRGLMPQIYFGSVLYPPNRPIELRRLLPGSKKLSGGRTNEILLLARGCDRTIGKAPTASG